MPDGTNRSNMWPFYIGHVDSPVVLLVSPLESGNYSVGLYAWHYGNAQFENPFTAYATFTVENAR